MNIPDKTKIVTEMKLGNNCDLIISNVSPIINAANKGLAKELPNEKVTYFRAIIIATIELLPTIAYPIAAPLTPYRKAKPGTNNQVNTDHMTINLKVVLIFPIEFNKLVSCVATAAKIVLTLINIKGIRAGVHLPYLGMIATKIGAKINNPTVVGKTKKQIK
jgi:hypothetical protein